MIIQIKYYIHEIMESMKEPGTYRNGMTKVNARVNI